MSHSTDSVFKDYIKSIEQEIDALIFEDIGPGQTSGSNVKKEAANNESLMMMEVFNQC